MNRFFSADREAVIQTTSHCFDSSVWQFFWPLLNGGLCFLPDESRLTNLDYLLSSIKRHSISIIDFTPALFSAVVQELKYKPSLRDTLSSVKNLIIGGDEVDINSVRDFKRIFQRIELINAYGPTETSIGVVFHRIKEFQSRRIPIGRL